MNFDLSDEQKMLAEQARGLLAHNSSPDRLRELVVANSEWDEPLWNRLAEMGFLGAAIPEAYGGLGLGPIDLGVISEELGRANAAVPFNSSIVLAANALLLAGSEAQKVKWLPRLASGEAVATVAHWEPGAMPTVRLENGELRGEIAPVADAGVAQIAMIQADSADGQVLALVELSSAGVSRTRLDSFDQLRPHFRLDFEGTPAEPLQEAAHDILAALMDRAAVQAAFEGLGGADACMVMARDYAMERRIFGRPLAGYQAIKHKLADICLKVEFARSNAYFAAWAEADAAHELPAAASAARLSALAAFEMAARENIQVHGGIGYTFEADCHFYFRRERTLALALGGRGHWADRLIAQLPGQQGRS